MSPSQRSEEAIIIVLEIALPSNSMYNVWGVTLDMQLFENACCSHALHGTRYDMRSPYRLLP